MKRQLFRSPQKKTKRQIPKQTKTQVAKIAETIATLSKNALTTSAPPTSAERSGLRKATHQLADLAKSGEWRRCFGFRGRERRKTERKKLRAELISDDDGKRSLSSPFAAVFFNLDLRFCSLFIFFTEIKTTTTEDNVDAVVEGGAVRAVVPLLTLFKVDEGRGVSR